MAAPPTELAAADAQVFEMLREWRRERADGKPAYTVCADRALRSIAVARPRDEQELLGITGVGPAFVERHSESLFALLQDAA